MMHYSVSSTCFFNMDIPFCCRHQNGQKNETVNMVKNERISFESRHSPDGEPTVKANLRGRIKS